MKSTISCIYENTQLQGILLKEDDTTYSIKIKSGYQVSVDKKNCSNVKITQETSEKIDASHTTKTNDKKSISKTTNTKTNSKLPNIAIFHTGGTIASKVDYKTGAVSSHFTPEELIEQFQELNSVANLQAFMIGNLMSEDLRFGHYNMILEAVKKHHTQFDGIIVSHGTDTMHYSSAALQYSLKHLNIPVLLVGAQRSSDRASSDAFSNLQAAITFISYSKQRKESYQPSFNRVGICMHNSSSDDSFVILDSINARKMHTSRRDAFKQVNFKPVCEISSTHNISNIREELFTISQNNEELTYTKYNEKLRIGVLYAHPHLHKEEILRLKDLYNGVILAGTGLGHIGLSEFDNISKQNVENQDAINEVASKIPVCLATQCINGKVNVNVYSSGRILLQSGVLGNYSALTIETQFIKLAYLLSKYNKKMITNDEWSENKEGFNTAKVVDNNEDCEY
ncbi:MAG: Glu-tRNA(Gln) amidotransferase subunit GatD [Candidatus Nanoarchaeia archaeon]